jgi:hypothetical protein
MLIVTLVLPGCATIGVVTGLGWLLSQVTVSPVVGVCVGVQTARAGSAAQVSAAAASAQTETVVRRDARKCADALEMGRGVSRFDEGVDRIIDISLRGHASH